MMVFKSVRATARAREMRVCHLGAGGTHVHGPDGGATGAGTAFESPDECGTAEAPGPNRVRSGDGNAAG